MDLIERGVRTADRLWVDEPQIDSSPGPLCFSSIGCSSTSHSGQICQEAELTDPQFDPEQGSGGGAEL